MKSNTYLRRPSLIAVCIVAVLSWDIANGQTVNGSDMDIFGTLNAPLGMPRLSDEAYQPGTTVLKKAAYRFADAAKLAAESNSHTKVKQRGRESFIELGPREEWEYGITGRKATVNYITFTINASLGTQIQVDGISLSLEPSQRDAGYAALYATTHDSSGKVPLNHEMPLLLFGGARMVILDIVTLKIDRNKYQWSLWLRDIPIAENLTFDPPASLRAQQVRIVSGAAGAWVCGLVTADENPLFEDQNQNDVPDGFELRQNGLLAPSAASQGYIAEMRVAWENERRKQRPSEFIVKAPVPDSYPDVCTPEGTPVHGMTGGLKYGPQK